MPNQSDPVTSDEFVLRRIPNNKDWYESSLPEPVQRVAFQPSKRDTDGLSIFRQLFVTPAQLAQAGPNPAGYYVARLRVADLHDLGLSVIAAPQNNQPDGHAIIPELSYQAMKQDKQTARKIQRELAKLASDGIVHGPNGTLG